ncbi:hypothetical protein HDU87_003903 [Geranomyces variabilis]|uniref:Mediator of RNA polymerase II transcription subunit 21 n=1 Tax=Geranomyces variabilis TaxID=109894 RepID=A0AAD5TSX8_9FUNG|nr:hypothetical protein HDU87_003903 [Geranomyces variabilis]
MDRVSQLQDLIDKTVQDFATALLEIQNVAPPVAVDPSIPVTFVAPEQVQTQANAANVLTQQFVTSMKTTAQQLDVLIDNLPGINLTELEQLARMRALDEESCAADEELERAVAEANRLMAEVRTSFERSTAA